VGSTTRQDVGSTCLSSFVGLRLSVAGSVGFAHHKSIFKSGNLPFAFTAAGIIEEAEGFEYSELGRGFLPHEQTKLEHCISCPI